MHRVAAWAHRVAAWAHRVAAWVHVRVHVHVHVHLVALQSNYVGLQALLSPDFYLRRKLHLVGVTHVPKLLGGGFR